MFLFRKNQKGQALLIYAFVILMVLVVALIVVNAIAYGLGYALAGRCSHQRIYTDGVGSIIYPSNWFAAGANQRCGFKAITTSEPQVVATPEVSPWTQTTEEVIPPVVSTATDLVPTITPTPGGGRPYPGCYLSLDKDGDDPVRDMWGNRADPRFDKKPAPCDESQDGQGVPGKGLTLFCTCGSGP
jgi:hypothetical protein